MGQKRDTFGTKKGHFWDKKGTLLGQKRFSLYFYAFLDEQSLLPNSHPA